MFVRLRRGERLAECPFCGSQVSEELVTYGGTCPKCFAEIPGEEAATDPGVEVKAALDRRDRRRATFRTVALLSVMMALVLCTGSVALVTLLWPEPEVAAILDFDELDFPIPDIAGVEEVALGAPRKPRPRSSPGSVEDRAGRLGSGVDLGNGASASELGEDGTAEVDPARRVRTELGPLVPERTASGSSPGSSSGAGRLSIDMPTVRRDDNVVLSDPDAIRDMIGERLVEFMPGLTVCYDRRLKVSPTLKGRWRLKFSVLPSGAVSGASAEGLDRRDRELEACVAEHISEHWRFGRITVTQPVSRTLKFYPE
jgi:hypothetical protein